MVCLHNYGYDFVLDIKMATINVCDCDGLAHLDSEDISKLQVCRMIHCLIFSDETVNLCETNDHQ